MMVECPRCGFSQPKDQFCASCGVDMEHFAAQPKPLWLRIAQNPNVHLSLIGVLVVLVISYIIYSQSEMVSRQVNELLDLPVPSRDAADPDDEPMNRRREPMPTSRPYATTTDDQSQAARATALNGGDVPKVGTAMEEAEAEPLKITYANKLEVSHWEVPREVVANLIALADKIADGNAGRAYQFTNGAKALEQLQNVGQRLSLGRSLPTRVGEQLTVETPPTSLEAFQFGLFIQINKMDGKSLGLKWDSQLVLPQMETPAEAASAAPAVRAILETRLAGSATLAAASVVLIVMEPVNRSPREELLMRVGEGPWTVFASPEFRSGMTEWVIALQIR